MAITCIGMVDDFVPSELKHHPPEALQKGAAPQISLPPLFAGVPLPAGDLDCNSFGWIRKIDASQESAAFDHVVLLNGLRQ